MSCLPGYFLDGESCYECDYPCETCAFSSKNCINCKQPEDRLSSDDGCACKVGYADNG